MSECKEKSLFRKIVGVLCSIITWFVLLIGALWAFGALWYDFPQASLRPWMAGVFGLLVILVPCFVKPRWRAKIGIALTIVLILIWWLSIQPKQYRDWKPEVALTSYAKIEGDIVTIYNVRNFDYRTETDFTPHYEMRRFDLNNLKGLDIFVNYWGSPYMAHPIVSFDFGPDGRICFSIETRSVRGQGFSAIGGLYRQYELIYIAADERDVIRVRTNYRGNEQVYLYHLRAPHAKLGFLEYVNSINELHERPRWYNAITDNCTSAIRHQQVSKDRPPWDWRMLVNGYGDQLLYQRGNISHAFPFAELKQRSLINDKAKAANNDPDFSEKIRVGLPALEAQP